MNKAVDEKFTLKEMKSHLKKMQKGVKTIKQLSDEELISHMQLACDMLNYLREFLGQEYFHLGHINEYMKYKPLFHTLFPECRIVGTVEGTLDFYVVKYGEEIYLRNN